MKRKIFKAWTTLIVSALIFTGCSAKKLDMAKDMAVEQTVSSGDSGGTNGYMEESVEASAVDTGLDMEVSEDMAEGAGVTTPEISEKDLSGRKLIKTADHSFAGSRCRDCGFRCKKVKGKILKISGSVFLPLPNKRRASTD